MANKVMTSQMKFDLLCDEDRNAMDALKEYHGGAEEITQTIEQMRDFEAEHGIDLAEYVHLT